MKWFNKATSSFDIKYLQDGLQPVVLFECNDDEFKSIFDNFSSKSNESLCEQYVLLKMLEEQGLAESVKNGFIVNALAICRLSRDMKNTLTLPDDWTGTIFTNITSKTNSPTFAVDLSVSPPNDNKGNKTYSYEIKGPIIKFGENSQYLLTSAQMAVFLAQEAFNNSKKEEFDKVSYLHQLQSNKEAGADIKLQHFENLTIHAPDKITLSAEIDEEGDLYIAPNAGQESDFKDMCSVMGQAEYENTSSIKIRNEIILLNQEKVKSVREIIRNKKIPKDIVPAFLKNPSAYIDASLVDLDVGFSIRVKGATTFKHAYFGETDNSGTDWFGQASGGDIVHSVSQFEKDISDLETLELLKSVLSDAEETGSEEISFEGKNYDISNKEELKKTLVAIENKLQNVSHDEDEDLDGNEDPEIPEQKETIVVDIELNDETLSQSSPIVAQKIDEVSRKSELTWDNYLRTPFPHQEKGVRWTLGIFDEAERNPNIEGAILADDMGLGKTFMALSAVENRYRELLDKGKIPKPTLIVAPLSLLENWEDEVSKTFKHSPFSDIVILQSDGHLSRFKKQGMGSETKSVIREGEEIQPLYSLKIGSSEYDRLDTPKRLVITTYQTLRDYQFSLCKVDWEIVVFDEAQNIKNPNTLATRAAKGLKSFFKLVATGTPVENSLADFWCLMDTACPNYLDTYQEFRAKYITPITKASEEMVDKVRVQVGRELREYVGAMMLRRLKEDTVDGLPKKHIHVGIKGDNWEYQPYLDKTMKGIQLDRYDSALGAYHIDPSGSLSVLHRLRDSSLHPRLSDGGRMDCPTSLKEINSIISESEKMESLIEVLNSVKQKNEKCIVFVINKRLQAFLSVSLGKKYGLGPVQIVNGDTKAVSKNNNTATRKSIISDFENKEGFNVIIMSPIAAGVGLTVVGANHAIHFERHWNPAKEAQATDRVYRIGQEKDVHIYVPILRHPHLESFDLNLHKLLSKKLQLKDAVVTPEQVKPSIISSNVDFEISKKSSKPVSINDVKGLSPDQFEALSLILLEKEYNADASHLTASGKDKGVDGILTKNNKVSLIQSKHTTKENYQGEVASGKLLGAKALYEKSLGQECEALYLVTNGKKVNEQEKQMAQSNNVVIINGKDLGKLLKKHTVTMVDLYAKIDGKRRKV